MKSLLLITGHILATVKPQTLREYMNSDGKIHIVLAVTALILTGFGICILFIDRKLKKAIQK